MFRAAQDRGPAFKWTRTTEPRLNPIVAPRRRHPIFFFRQREVRAKRRLPLRTWKYRIAARAKTFALELRAPSLPEDITVHTLLP